MPTASRLVATLLLGFLLPASAAAQRYPTHTYTVSDGLPSAQVFAAVQDTLGQMWFATRTGIVVYDGHDMQTQGHGDGLETLQQEFLLRDRQGTLYAAGALPYSQALRHDGSRWIAIGSPGTHNFDYRILSAGMADLDGEDVLLLGSDDGTLHSHHPTRGWAAHPLPEVGPTECLMAILRQPGGAWLVTASRILRLTGQPGALRFEVVARAPEGERFESAAPDDTGGHWVLGRRAIHRLDSGGLHPVADTPSMYVTDPESHFHLRSWAMEPDGLGGFFAATVEKVLHYHPSSGAQFLGLENGLASAGATALTTDREGNLWITGLRGITKLMGLSLASWDASHGLQADEVTAVLQRARGDIILGHPNGLTFFGDGALVPIDFASARLHGRVLDLWEDPDGTVWASCADKGLLRIDPDGSQRWFLQDQHVNSALRDANGDLWICTMYDLYRMDGSRFVPRGLPGDIEGQSIQGRRLFPARDGGFFLASRRFGLIEFETDGSYAWSKAQRSLPGVYALLEFDDGTLWVGTGNGLYAVTDDAELTVGAGYPGPRVDRPVYFLTRDHTGEVWIGTDNGVIRWNGVDATSLTIQDGLAGRETNRAAGVVDDQGRVWIGTERGVTVFDRRLEAPSGSGPLAWVDRVEIDGDSYPLHRSLELPHHRNSLTFQFKAISFVDESRVRVESWLEGFERDWLPPYASPLQEIRYTNLPPGEYRFHLRSIDAAGQRSPVVSSASIVLTPALWQRPWFWILLALATVGLLAAAFVGISRSRYAKQLEREVEERVQELAQSEAAKAAESRRLSVTLESITDGVITTDHDGAVVLLNPAAAAITGWPAEDAVGQPLRSVLPLHTAEPGDELPHGDLTLTTRDGRSRTIEITSAPVRQQAGGGGTVLAFRDITGKRAIEAELSQAQRLQSLGVLAGGIAHDFNNLLTVVLGNVSLVAQDSDPVAAKRLGDAREATLRARTLTQQLLTFSRGGEPSRAAASVAEIVRQNVSFALSGSNSRCELDLPDGLWPVDLDPDQIGQVLNNLLLNASQAMPDGGVVRVSAANVADGVPGLPAGDYVRISIRDIGPGIPDGVLAHIFDPYFSTKPEGTGLGLATAYSIVRRHDGLLSAESHPGSGTTFHIHLPRSSSPGDSEREDTPGASHPRILVMDDDEDVRQVIASLLRSSGFDPTVVSDGEEAVDAYRLAMEEGRRFAVAILDLTVRGGMGGTEAMARIRELDPGARGVVASGYSNDPVLADPIGHGFQGRLTKPFLREDLRAVLGGALEQRTGS